MPNLTNEALFLKRVQDIVSSQIFTNGNYILELEALCKEYLGVRYALVFPSAVALETILISLFPNIKGEILLSSLNSTETINAIYKAGHVPRAVDINPDFCLSIEDLEDKISAKSIGILAHNTFGNLCDLNALKHWKALGLNVVFDSTHALGAVDEPAERYVGNFGDCELFHLNSILPGGDLSIITTNDVSLAEVIFYQQKNYENSEFSAALALTTFECLQELIEHNFNNFELYKRYLPSNISLKEKNTFFSNFAHVLVEVDPILKIRLINKLATQDINIGLPLFGIHESLLSNTKYYCERLLCLPTGFNISEKEIQFICEKLSEGI